MKKKENIGARVVSALLTGTDGTVYVGYKKWIWNHSCGRR